MEIRLTNAGKRFYREWIFRGIDLHIGSSENIALLGPNGSGKSTLLQLISGATLPTEGSVSYSENNQPVDPERVYKHVSMAAPYLELIEDFTLEELIHFHFSFKKIRGSVTASVLEETGLSSKAKSQYRFFSSGMKQRVKLTLALCSDTSLLFLDEPCSNLDQAGIEWYSDMILKHGSNRTVLVASNTVKEEYAFCSRIIHLTDYKK